MLRSSRAARNDDEIHAIAPGEIILGYPDNLNSIPPSPSLAGCTTRSRSSRSGNGPVQASSTVFAVRVQRAPRSRLQRNVSVLRTTGEGRRGLRWVAASRGGQTTAANPRQMLRHSNGRQDLDCGEAHRALARWHVAGSLSKRPRHAVSTRRGHRQRFHLCRDDPAGLCCLLGAHIRRANPRDSLNPSAHIRGDEPAPALRRARASRSRYRTGIGFSASGAPIATTRCHKSRVCCSCA